jgi:hypothetical protein
VKFVELKKLIILCGVVKPGCCPKPRTPRLSYFTLNSMLSLTMPRSNCGKEKFKLN